MGPIAEAISRSLTLEASLAEQRLPRVELLDPVKVCFPRWMQGLPAAHTSEYLSLRDSVARFGRNVEPIKVLQVADDRDHVLVFGRKRLQACFETGLPVYAIVERMADDREAFQEFFSSNLQWPLADLARLLPFALDSGMYPSMRRLADACGLELTQVSYALWFGRLPVAVRESIPRHETLTPGKLKALFLSYDRDPDGVRGRVAAARAVGGKQAEALRALSGG